MARVMWQDAERILTRVPEKNAFPTVLERALRERGYKVEVSNAGVSGDTATNVAPSASISGSAF